MYPCFIAVIKYGYEFGAYELNHEYTLALTRTSTHSLFPR